MPVLAEFTATLRNNVELRSYEPTEQVDTGENMAEEIILNPLSDRYYVVLAESPEGYYVVKCLNVSQDTFVGRYFSPLSSQDQTNSIFKETKEKDTFHCKTLLGEILSAEKVTLNRSVCVSINKVELNDFILTIAGIESI